jgi:putative monooxygenase
MSDKSSESGDFDPPRPAVLRPSEIPSRDRGGGARTIPLVTRKVGATGFINGITIFDPGASVPMHSHNCEESVVVLEGEAIVETGSLEYRLGPNDTTFFPANIPHRFKNASTTERMRILWIYASINATRTIIATGDTKTIDDEHRSA